MGKHSSHSTMLFSGHCSAICMWNLLHFSYFLHPLTITPFIPPGYCHLMTFYSWCFSHWRLSLQDHSLPLSPKPHHHLGWLQCPGQQTNHNCTSHSSVRAIESLWALWGMRPQQNGGRSWERGPEGRVIGSEQGLLMSPPETLMWWTSQSLQETQEAIYI